MQDTGEWRILHDYELCQLYWSEQLQQQGCHGLSIYKERIILKYPERSRIPDSKCGELHCGRWSPKIDGRGGRIYGMEKGPHHFLWPCSRAKRGKITVSDTPKSVNYCVIFTAHTQFTNVTAGWKPMLYGKPRLIEGRGAKCYDGDSFLTRNVIA